MRRVFISCFFMISCRQEWPGKAKPYDPPPVASQCQEQTFEQIREQLDRDEQNVRKYTIEFIKKEGDYLLTYTHQIYQDELIRFAERYTYETRLIVQKHSAKPGALNYIAKGKAASALLEHFQIDWETLTCHDIFTPHSS